MRWRFLEITIDQLFDNRLRCRFDIPFVCYYPKTLPLGTDSSDLFESHSTHGIKDGNNIIL